MQHFGHGINSLNFENNLPMKKRWLTIPKKGGTDIIMRKLEFFFVASNQHIAF